jgi:hypothetical protein
LASRVKVVAPKPRSGEGGRLGKLCESGQLSDADRDDCRNCNSLADANVSHSQFARR